MGLLSDTGQGRVVEVLVGRAPRVQTLHAKHESPGADYLLTTPITEVQVTLEGFLGDRHAGFTRHADGRTPFYRRGTLIGNNRQVSLVSIEELAQIAAAMAVPTIEAAWLGANLALAGVPKLSKIQPGTRVFFPDEATLVITAENHPCVFPGKLIQAHYPERPGVGSRFPKLALGRRGLVAWVERPGRIRAGDTVRIVAPRD